MTRVPIVIYLLAYLLIVNRVTCASERDRMGAYAACMTDTCAILIKFQAAYISSYIVRVSVCTRGDDVVVAAAICPCTSPARRA